MEQLRLDQAIRNVICGDLEIPLLVIQLGVIPPGRFWRKGKEG